MKQYQHHQQVLKSLKAQYHALLAQLQEGTDMGTVHHQVLMLAAVQVFRVGYQHLIGGIIQYCSLHHKTWKPTDVELKAMVRIAQAHDLTELSTTQWQDLQDNYKLSAEAYLPEEQVVILQAAPKLFEAIDYFLLAAE